MLRSANVSIVLHLLKWLWISVFSLAIVSCGGGNTDSMATSTTLPLNSATQDGSQSSSNNSSGATPNPQEPATNSTNTAGSTARFNFPVGITIDSAGILYIADRNNHTIRKITPSGSVSTLAGAAGNAGNTDGLGALARFDLPTGIAVDGAGNIYVTDSGSHTIRKITPLGLVTTLAGMPGNNGSTDGLRNNALFNTPTGIELDSSGNAYVADTLNNTIRKVSPEGLVTTLAGMPGAGSHADGTGGAARFIHPEGVTIDASGNLYITDTDYFPTCHFCTRTNSTIRKITPAGIVTTVAGKPLAIGSADGTGTAALFAYPAGITVDGAGNLYVADTQNDTIRKITPAGVVTTVAGSPKEVGSVDGTGSAARFAFPKGITLDTNGNLYVTESFTVRKVSPSGQATTVAGKALSGGSADSTAVP